MACLCLRNDEYRNSQMCIVTGPNIDIAIKLIKKMKTLFEPNLHVTFDSKETVLELNGCSIEAYPSNHLDDTGVLDNPKSINLEHKAMLGHCKMIFEGDGRKIAINPDTFGKLITALRTAIDNDGTLDKEATSYNDIFDAFRLALRFYHFEQQQPLVGSSLQRLFSKRVVEQDIVDFANFFERCHIDSGSDGNGDGSSSSNTSNSTN
jgi:hypothetical protein